MLNKLLWMGMVLTLLFPILSVADCHPNCPPQHIVDPSMFNPDDPSSFDYTSGDYSTITDWSQVDWSQIPAYRIPKDVPVQHLDYFQLDSMQRQEMSVEQITANFENIENLAMDVNAEIAKTAIQQTTGVTVQEFYSGARIRTGMLVAADGQLDFAGKAGWTVEVDPEGKIVVVEPSQISEMSITTQDYFKLDFVDFTTSEGETHLVSRLHFRQGK